MDEKRRQFLRLSLTVLGAAAGTAITRKMCSAQAAEPAPADPKSACSSSGCSSCGLALTPEHTLAQVGGGPAPEPADQNGRQGVPGRRWIMVIDLSKCDGCGHCQMSCSKMHFVPPGRQWIKVLRLRDNEHTSPYFFPQPCYHCDNPPCTKVCPVDATFKRTDGVVLIDNDRCIGCRFCMAACPYGARSFNWGKPNDPKEAADAAYSMERGYPRKIGTVEKCDFCPDMAEQGKLPACAAGCPMGVIYYGDQNEDAVTNGLGQTVRLSSFLRDNAAYRHLEELGTEPRVYYLPPKDRIYPGPDDESENHAS
jgi:molybdopterin-containing oxidoreductase family iron-sulfur binding subunit